jgi:phosphatidylinositol phospholipase C, gamma-1
MDLSNSEKNGILYMEDTIERDWVPHFFVLTQAKMFYTEVQQEDNEPEEAEEEESDSAQQRIREVCYLINF